MSQYERREDHKPDCPCLICAAVKSGATWEEAVEAHRQWEEENLSKYGWICHFVSKEDPCSPTGFNCHTHGLPHSARHLDFQLVVPMESSRAHRILINLVDQVKAGVHFEPGYLAVGILEGLFVTFVAARENDRDVLRVILPDRNGCLQRKDMEAPWDTRYLLYE